MAVPQNQDVYLEAMAETTDENETPACAGSSIPQGIHGRQFKAWYLVYHRNRHGRNGTHKETFTESRVL